uniref:Uncharacterized protein n=1 Tax=Amblyomma tuberculatum TaxID=48802 RepID=A0A6M2E143_9ACAR
MVWWLSEIRFIALCVGVSSCSVLMLLRAAEKTKFDRDTDEGLKKLFLLFSIHILLIFSLSIYHRMMISNMYLDFIYHTWKKRYGPTTFSYFLLAIIVISH